MPGPIRPAARAPGEGCVGHHVLCAFLLVVGSAFALLLVAACGGSDQSQDLRGVPWRWSARLEGGDARSLVPVADPANYLLRLDDDGTFIGKADCRSLAGAYALSGHDLTLDLGPTTKAACGAKSRSDEYIGLLRRVATYEVSDQGTLALGLENDGGYLYFYRPSTE
jgi:heat shock protein HslJ